MTGKAKALGSQEVKRVLSALKNPCDKTLFLTGLYTGLRIFELISIEQNQILTTSGGVRNILKLQAPTQANTSAASAHTTSSRKLSLKPG